MKITQHTTEQIIKILDQAATGKQSVAMVCREHVIAQTTFYRTAPGMELAAPRCGVTASGA